MKIVDFFYTQSEVAGILGVNPITIWRWVREGRFDVQRVGGVVLIPKWEAELIRTKQKKRRAATP